MPCVNQKKQTKKNKAHKPGLEHIWIAVHFYSGCDLVHIPCPHPAHITTWHDGIWAVCSCLPDPDHKLAVAILHVNQKQTTHIKSGLVLQFIFILAMTWFTFYTLIWPSYIIYFTSLSFNISHIFHCPSCIMEEGKSMACVIFQLIPLSALLWLIWANCFRSFCFIW